MKRILILLIGLISVAQAQFAPTSTKSAFKWGISAGTRDSTAYGANDSLVVVINRQGRMMYRSTDGYWKILSNAGGSDFVPYTGAVDNVALGNYRLTARSIRMDSIYANGSGGAVAVTNSGTRSFSWGAGGSSQVTFYGFAGMDYNRSGSMTSTSFTPKVYVDSSGALRVRYTDTTSLLSQVVRTFGTQTIGGNKTFSNDISINGINAGRAGGNLIGTTAFGNGALVANTTGYENTAFGYQALNVVDTGFRNSAFGWKALSKNVARYNSAFGFSAMEQNITGNSNTGIGVNALRDNTTGSLNTGLGHDALEYNITGSNNTGLGYRTLVLNTTGNANTGVGSRSLYYNTTGSNNTAIGYGTLDSNLTGFGNIAMGYEALKQQKSDNYNIGIGYTSLFKNNGGNTNTAIGFNAMANNLTGDNNNVIGASTLFSNTAGSNNTALGYLTLYNTLGSRNIALGNYAGFYSTGSDEFFVNNQNRTNYLGDTSLGLLYGKMDALTALQRLRVNGNLIVSGGATFGGRAGYNRSNYSSILTDSSFTHKKYVDSIVALKIGGSGTINTIPLWTGSTITLGNSSMTSTSGRIQVGAVADDGSSQMRVNGFLRGGIIVSDAGNRINGTAGGWDRKYAFFGSAGTDRGGFGAFGGTDALTYYYIGSTRLDNAVQFDATTKQATFNGVVSATTGIISLSGVTAQRGRFTSLVVNKDSVPITTANAWVLTVDTSGTPYTNRVNRRNINDFYVGNASFDTTARTLTLPKAGGGSTVVTIPRGTASGTSGITVLSSSRTGNLVTVSGDNGSSTIFSVRDADSSAPLSTLTASYGISGSPYNGSSNQTWLVDTSVISTKANVTGLLVGYATTGDNAAKLNISDTTLMLDPYRRKTTKIENSDLANATISGVFLGNNLANLNASYGLTGGSYNGNGGIDFKVDTSVISTKANVTSLLDGYALLSGANFSGGITGTSANLSSTLVAGGSITGSSINSQFAGEVSANLINTSTGVTWSLRNGVSESLAFSNGTSNVLILNPTNSTFGSKLTSTGSLKSEGILQPISLKTSDYTLTENDHTVIFDATSANRTATLPAGVEGQIFVIKGVGMGANSVTIAASSGQTIENGSSYNINIGCSDVAVTIQFLSGNWNIISSHITPCL